MPMKTMHEALFKAGMLDEEQEQKEETEDQKGPYCQYHEGSVGHSV